MICETSISFFNGNSVCSTVFCAEFRAVDKTSGGSTQRTLTYYPMAGGTPHRPADTSPKLGRFLSADTIVPGYANPQNLNRYSYVNNSPLMYTDPTGHIMDSGCVNREFSNCGGTDTDAGTYEPDDPSDDGGGGSNDEEETADDDIVSTTIFEGIHLGPYAPFSAPDYDDDSYNGWPSVYGPYDDSNNFYLFFTVEYSQTGITMSDIRFLNGYSGTAKIDTVQINKRDVYTGNSYLSSPSGFFPGSGGKYDGKTPIRIEVTVSYVTDIGHGPARIPVSFQPITLPSVSQFRHFMQTGKAISIIPTP